MLVWDTSRRDWRERIVAGESIIPDLPLWHAKAAKALRIFKNLRLKDVPGYPTMGEACPQWIFDFVYTLFGAADEQTRRQVVRYFLLMVAKKNAKSCLAAGIMMTALIMNDRDEGEFTILAPTKEIANNSFIPALGMVQLDPDLRRVFHGNRNYRTIEHKIMGSKLKVVAADEDTVGGIKSVVTLYDELWLFGKKASFENILSEVEGALASKPEGFNLYLTTQSDDPPTGEFKKILERMRKIRDGEIQDPTSLAVIHEFPEEIIKGEAWLTDESLWHIPNPNINHSVDAQFLREKLKKAIEEGKSALNMFAAKHFNIEVGGRMRTDSWVGAEFWGQCAGNLAGLDDLIARSEVVVIGIDGGGLDDLLGLAVVGREIGTGKWLVWCRAWAHKVVLERRKDVASKIMELVDAGEIRLVETPGDDVAEVCDVVFRIRDAGLLAQEHTIGVDSVGIGEIVNALTADGTNIAIDRIAAISQGWKLSGAIKTTERSLASRLIVHDGRALMPWVVGNAKADPKGNATSINKAVSGSAKIDPLMALFNAISIMMMNPTAAGRSIYEERGLRIA